MGSVFSEMLSKRVIGIREYEDAKSFVLAVSQKYFYDLSTSMSFSMHHASEGQMKENVCLPLSFADY